MDLREQQLQLQSETIEAFEEKMKNESCKKLKNKNRTIDDTFEKKYLKKIAKDIYEIRKEKLSKIVGNIFKHERHKEQICALYNEREMKAYKLEDKAKEIAKILQDKIEDKSIFYFRPKKEHSEEEVLKVTFEILKAYSKNLEEAKKILDLKQKEHIFTLATFLLSSGEVTWITLKSIGGLLEKKQDQEDDNSTSQQAIINNISENIFEHVAFKFKKENIEIEAWENDSEIEIGETPFSLLMEHHILEEFEKEGSFINLKFSNTFEKETKNIYENIQKFMPLSFEPMIVSPTPWTSIDNGGFLKDEKSSPKFDLYIIKSTTKRDKENVKTLKENFSPKLLEAINIIQETSWQINSDIVEDLERYLHTIQRVNKEKVKILEAEKKEYYKFFASIKTKIKNQKELLQEMAFTEEDINKKLSPKYKEQKVKETLYHKTVKKINKLKSDINIKKIILQKAIKYQSYNEIFFVWQVDFRGRTYPAQPLLNPQGDDFTKSLLRFATKKSLGKNGEKWFKIHGANLYGKDKISFEERVQWIDNHQEDIVSIFNSSDKFENEFLKKADKPFSFLAFAYEYKSFIENPKIFQSSIPIAMDGSNNGFQHITALLRDKKGAKKVNVLATQNQTIPNDIYKDVALQTQQIILESEDLVLTKERLTPSVLEINTIYPKITRSLTKQNVMTEVYGAGEKAKIEQIEEYIEDKLQEELNWETQTIKEVSLYLQSKIAEAIKEELSSSNIYKRWMKKIAKTVSEKNQEIRWKTPIIGLEVIQEEFETKKDTISTKYNGKKKNIQIKVPKKNEEGNFIIDKKEQNKGIAPNFIHSLDATHLFLTILEAHKNGINAFATIHDSFGTHACDIEALQRAIKKTFVEMYSIDILATLKEDIKNHYNIELKSIKYQGTKEAFNLEEVLKSDYFFS